MYHVWFHDHDKYTQNILQHENLQETYKDQRTFSPTLWLLCWLLFVLSCRWLWEKVVPHAVRFFAAHLAVHIKTSTHSGQAQTWGFLPPISICWHGKLVALNWQFNSMPLPRKIWQLGGHELSIDRSWSTNFKFVSLENTDSAGASEKP